MPCSKCWPSPGKVIPLDDHGNCKECGRPIGVFVESPTEILEYVRRTLRCPEGAALTEHAKEIAEFLTDLFVNESEFVDNPLAQAWLKHKPR